MSNSKKIKRAPRDPILFTLAVHKWWEEFKPRWNELPPTNGQFKLIERELLDNLNHVTFDWRISEAQVRRTMFDINTFAPIEAKTSLSTEKHTVHNDYFNPLIHYINKRWEERWRDWHRKKYPGHNYDNPTKILDPSRSMSEEKITQFSFLLWAALKAIIGSSVVSIENIRLLNRDSTSETPLLWTKMRDISTRALPDIIGSFSKSKRPIPKPVRAEPCEGPTGDLMHEEISLLAVAATFKISQMVNRYVHERDKAGVNFNPDEWIGTFMKKK